MFGIKNQTIFLFLGLVIFKCILTQACVESGCIHDGVCVAAPEGHECACGQGFSGQTCEGVVFESREILDAVDQESLSVSDAERYRDSLNTGSMLFDLANATQRSMKLSLNIQASQLMPNNENYLRTHPLFVKCLQKTITYAKNREGITVLVSSAYVPADMSDGSTVVGQHAAAGTGAVLTASEGSDIEHLTKIVDSALTSCATDLFSGAGRYIGLVLQADSVHVHMSTAQASGPHCSVRGNSHYTDQQFLQYCHNKINSVLDPIKDADCRSVQAFAQGGVFPTGATSPETVVGSSDADDSSQTRLVVYPGSNVGYSGRLDISTRMFDVIRKLRHYIAVHTSNADTIRILRAYDPSSHDLYGEGRALDVQLQSGDSTLLGLLAKYAVCAGADYVEYQGDQVQLDVKKQATIRSGESMVTFANSANVLKVKANDPTMHLIRGSEHVPLFDAQYQEASYVGDFATLGQFRSTSSRYMRLDPALAQCYDRLVNYDKKWNEGVRIPINVVVGYMTRSDFAGSQPSSLEMNHLRGMAMLLQYGSVESLSSFATSRELVFDAKRLAENAVKLCGPIFSEKKHMELGVVVANDQVSIQIKHGFTFQIEEQYLPVNSSVDGYYDRIDDMYANALDNRIVNPESPVRACERDFSPKVKSVDFRYEHPHHVQSRRRRRQAGEEEEHGCVPERNTAFCQQSQLHRTKEIDYLWTQFKRKHFYHDETELREAFEGCFDNCGTCLLGEVYEDKTEHCTNLLHWLPFELMNERENSTHLYDRRDSAMKRLACLEEGKQCLFNAPLYAILASTIEKLYRPDPQSSVEEQLYSATSNPLPVYEVLYPMFAVNARGLVTVWVANKQQIQNLRAPLKAVMLYNPRVTHVRVMVNSSEALDGVSATMDTIVQDWTRTGCPLTSRPAIAPFSLHLIPEESHRNTRSVAEDGFSFNEELLDRLAHFERHWVNKVRG